MSKAADLHPRLDGDFEITLSVKGRKSGKDIQANVFNYSLLYVRCDHVRRER